MPSNTNLWVAAWPRQQTNNDENHDERWPPLPLPLNEGDLKLVGHVPEDKMACLETKGKRLLIVGDCRLDNRAELSQQLQLEAGVPNLQIIGQAYLRWDERCVDALLGAFVFAIWDVAAQQLFCARDHMGIRSLFYYCDRDCVVFSNKPQGVLRHPAVPHRPNLRQIAGLTMLSVYLQEPEDTFFEQIKTLPSATTLRLTPKTAHKTVYWQPDPHARLPMSPAEIPEALRHLLSEAVTARLPQDGPALALLSGGLDSSAVVAVAADLLKQQNRPLITLSSVLPADHSPDLEDESSFINQFQNWDNIEMVRITADQRGPFDNIEELMAVSKGAWYTSRHYLYSTFAETAQYYQTEHILDGLGGEIGPTFHADGFYPEQLLHGRWLLLARELWWRTKQDQTSLKSVVKNHLLIPLIPVNIARWFGYDLRRFDAAQFRDHHILQPAFIDTVLADQVALEEHMELMFKIGLNLRQNQARDISQAQRLFEPVDFVGNDWVTFTYPFFDKRVIEFCLAAPSELKVHRGYKRYLIRAALDGLLPPQIQWRTSKQPFSPDYHLRYNRQRPWVEQFLAAIAPDDPVRQIVNVDKIQHLAASEMKGSRANTPTNMAAIELVPMGIYLITFLRQFAEFR